MIKIKKEPLKSLNNVIDDKLEKAESQKSIDKLLMIRENFGSLFS